MSLLIYIHIVHTVQVIFANTICSLWYWRLILLSCALAYYVVNFTIYYSLSDTVCVIISLYVHAYYGMYCLYADVTTHKKVQKSSSVSWYSLLHTQLATSIIM